MAWSERKSIIMTLVVFCIGIALVLGGVYLGSSEVERECSGNKDCELYLCNKTPNCSATKLNCSKVSHQDFEYPIGCICIEGNCRVVR